MQLHSMPRPLKSQLRREQLEQHLQSVRRSARFDISFLTSLCSSVGTGDEEHADHLQDSTLKPIRRRAPVCQCLFVTSRCS